MAKYKHTKKGKETTNKQIKSRWP